MRRASGDIPNRTGTARAVGHERAALLGADDARPIGSVRCASRNYGDAVRIPLSRNRSFFLLDRPEYAEHVLVRHQDRYVKGFDVSAAAGVHR